MLYFPLAFAQEYFTLINGGQFLLHLPSNTHFYLRDFSLLFRL